MTLAEGVPSLPEGTVSLLFADVEGSTLLVRRLGDQWAPTIDLMRRLCRQAWSQHGGHELGTEGDSFFVVFSTADAAVAAATQAHRSMHSASWPSAEPLRIRIGIHTGSPRRHADGYIGLDVHTAARIAAAASGGQTLLSGSTAALLTGAQPGSAGVPDLHDLGEHQLKDIPGRTRLYRLRSEGAPDVDTPPRTVGGVGKLPVTLTPFVGRGAELGDLEMLLARSRLVTLTGPGGSGKTRLAIEIAQRATPQYPDGVFFVPLASVSSPEGMWWAMSQVLDIPADGQVPPGFFSYVAARRQLLILDNLEQIAGARDVVRELLAEAPHLALLATSRGSLRLDGEHEFRVEPLGLPGGDEPLADLAASEAVQLFASCAQRARQDFRVSESNAAAVADLCRALDGLPLAIELAAARVKLLTPQAILARIDRSLDLDARDPGRAERQRTVRAAIAWSYELLDGVQREVLNHLSVFEGGADLDAVAAVVPDDLLAGRDVVDVLLELVDLSLVRVTEGAEGETRVALLEMVRRFAGEQLESAGRASPAQAAHAEHYTAAAEEACVAFRTGRFDGLADRLRPDLRNLAAVTERMPLPVRHHAFPEGCVPPGIVVTLCSLAVLFAGEHQLCLRLTERLDPTDDPASMVGVLGARHNRAMSLWSLGHDDAALEEETEVVRGCLSLEQASPRPPVPEDFLVGLPTLGGLARTARGHLLLQRGADADQAARDAVEAIGAVSHLAEETLPSTLVRRAAHGLLARVASEAGRYDEALALYEETLGISRAAGDTWLEISVLTDLVDVLLLKGDPDGARATFRRLVPMALRTRSLLVTSVGYVAASLAAVDSPPLAARILAALETREVLAGGQLDPSAVSDVRASLPEVSDDQWRLWFSGGRDEPLEDLLLEVERLPVESA